MPTLERHLRAAATRLTESPTPHLDARVLAKYALGIDDAGLILACDRHLTAEEEAAIEALIERRARGEPVAQIVGEKEFFGLTFKTAPGVLTPRPDSETLIAAALRRRESAAALRILDLGTGTGCLLCALLSHYPKATGTGVDISDRAVEIARRNADRLGMGERAVFIEGEWEAAPPGGFDIIVSNPPYIPETDKVGLARDVKDFEDPRALFAGPDGLDGYRAVLAAAAARLSPAGLIILELGAGQNEAVRGLARAVFPDAGIETDADLAGRPRAFVIDLRLESGLQKSV
jgi:release factor glutamine methyltransferase